MYCCIYRYKAKNRFNGVFFYLLRYCNEKKYDVYIANKCAFLAVSEREFVIVLILDGSSEQDAHV